MNEIWKSIPGCPGYEASSFGNIRSWHVKNNHPLPTNPRVHKLPIYKHGYRMATLGKIRGHAHRFVLMAFSGRPPFAKAHAAHLNGDKLDNRIENLAWVSAKENESHKKIHGTRLYGERHPQSKLTEANVERIKFLRKQGKTLESIASEFKCDITNISCICLGKTWKHIYKDSAHTGLEAQRVCNI